MNIFCCRFIHLDNSFFNDCLFTLEFITKCLRGSKESLGGDNIFKNGRKNRERGQGLCKTLGWTSGFTEVYIKKTLMSIKFLEGFVMDPLRVLQKISQGLPITHGM